MSDFCQAFPHHFCFDKNLIIEHIGNHMKTTFPFIKRGETKLGEILHLTHPGNLILYNLEIPLKFFRVFN
jgi:hypothetical protein